jgi:DNA-binding Lrp family transcriptional regulator
MLPREEMNMGTVRHTPEMRRLDRIDMRILCELQKNSRITNVELALAVGLSASPCLTRVKRLEKSGYIASYGAQLRLEHFGDTLMVFTEVTLSEHRREHMTRFEAHVRGFEEIVECHVVSGGYDYLLKFVTRGVNHYQQVVDSLLDRHVGIEKYFSYLVIRTPFIKQQYRLESLLAQAPSGRYTADESVEAACTMRAGTLQPAVCPLIRQATARRNPEPAV